VPNPKYAEAEQAGRSLWGLDPYLYNFSFLPDNSLLIPRGLREKLISAAEKADVDYTLIDNRSKHDFVHVDSRNIKYRPYQYNAVLKLIGETEGFIVAPAGSGKTVVGLSLLPLLGQPMLWLTHTGPLADQAKERAESFLPTIGKIGLLGRGKWEIGELLTIAMVQTLVRRPDDLIGIRDRFGTVVLDEAHHAPASTFLKVIGAFNSYYLYGLTATPYRRDKLEQIMFQAIGWPKVTIDIDEVEKHGGIMKPVVRYRSVRSAKVEGNNIQTILKNNIVGNKSRNNMIVGDVIAEATKGNFCIVISDRKAHCEDLYELISLGWEKTGIATGNYSKKYVREQVQRYNDNEITVLVTTFSLLGEGFDVDFLNRAFIAMPFRAESKAEQLIGRIQRTAPGKTDAIVYDYVDVDIGVLKNQFHANKDKNCRINVYERLGLSVEPY